MRISACAYTRHGIITTKLKPKQVQKAHTKSVSNKTTKKLLFIEILRCCFIKLRLYSHNSIVRKPLHFGSYNVNNNVRQIINNKLIA